MASLEGGVIKILWSGYQGCSDKLSKEREHVRGHLLELQILDCVEPRPESQAPPYANTGHLYGCGLDSQSKADLLAFLRSN